jgi:hypothetical protein
MAIDKKALERLSTKDLEYYASGRINNMSDEGLEIIAGVGSERTLPAITVKDNKPFEFSLDKTISNIKPSAIQYGKNLASAFMSPIQSTNAILDIGAGALQNALPQRVVDIVNTTDVNRPEALQRAVSSRDVARNVGQYYKERLGGKENILRTLQEDPVGILSDASAILTGGGALVPKVGGAVKKAGAAIEPLNIAYNALQYGTAKAIPSSVAPKLYQSAAKFSTNLPEQQRAAMTETALKEQIMPTYSGLGKMEVLMADLGNNINKLVDTATDANVKIPATEVFKYINDAKDNLGGFKINAASDIAEINSIEQAFKRQIKANKSNYVTPRQLQDFKTDIYKRIDFRQKTNTPTIASEEVFSGMGKAAKEALSSNIPAIGNLNERLGTLLELKPNLTRSAGRIENANILPINAGIQASGGAALGGDVGAMVGAAQSILDMPRQKAFTALELYKKQKQGLGVFGDNNPRSSFIRQLYQQQGAYNNAPGLLYE